MVIMRRDNNELRYNSILLLMKEGNPNYYKQLIRNTRAFFYGMRKPELINDINKMIRVKIELKSGRKINNVLLCYSSMTYYNQFIINKFTGNYIYKYELTEWFDELEDWILQQLALLEQEIRFITPPKQWV